MNDRRRELLKHICDTEQALAEAVDAIDLDPQTRDRYEHIRDDLRDVLARLQEMLDRET